MPLTLTFSLTTKMQTNTDNSNEWIDWIENAISKSLIKYYDYKYFHNIKEIGSESFGKTYRANWKNLCKTFVLKTFNNFDKVIAKEIVNEVYYNLNWLSYYTVY
jgi:hypothetical protein